VAARRAAAVCHRYLAVVPRLLPAAPLAVRSKYLIVVPRLLPAVALVVHRRALLINRGTQAVARGAARCASHVLDRGARAGAQTVACGDATQSQQEKTLGT
jgi:hypothetical protein